MGKTKNTDKKTPSLCPKCHGAKEVPDPSSEDGSWKKCPQCDGRGYW